MVFKLKWNFSITLLPNLFIGSKPTTVDPISGFLPKSRNTLYFTLGLRYLDRA